MARFVFRLQPVLGHRQRLEDAQQIVLAAALNALREEERLRNAYAERRDAMREHIRRRHAEMDSDELRATYAHCDYLDRAIATQVKAVAKASSQADVERARLVELSQGKKILETLREQRRETFESESAAVEQREIDDVNARRYDRIRARGEGYQ